MIKALVVVGIFSFLVAVLFQNHAPITGQVLQLGNPTYDVQPAVAPKVHSTVLQIFSYIATKTRFGPVIIRKLLNDNGIVNLRELAAQIKLPPLYFPMRRLNAEEQANYQAAINADERSVAAVVSEGISPEGTFSSASSPLGLRSIEEYAARYREGKALPSQVIKRTLETIRAWEKQNFLIFSELQEDAVLEQARASDERHKAGKPLSIFDGVPVAFKDMMDVKGHHHYNGQNPDPAYAAHWHVAKDDDVMVKRFRAAGAIIMGLTLMSEGGVTPVGYNAHFQGPVSPYSWNRYSGGSSSGSAVAVATGLLPVAIGYDGGGSVRLPATMSGIHGLATTFARCPFTYHLDSTNIKAGPIAASASDAAITYALIAPSEPQHFYSTLYDGGVHGPPPPHLSGFHQTEDLSDVRLGVFTAWFNDSEPHIRERQYEAIRYLQSRGAEVVEIVIPHLQWIRLAHGLKIGTEFALGFDRAHHDPNSGLEPNTRITVGLGSTTTALEVLAGEKLRAWLFDYVTRLFKAKKLTAIVNPTIGFDVPILTDEAKLQGESDTATSLLIMKHISFVNFIGLPSYTVPVGFLSPQQRVGKESSSLVLPVGLQLIGDHWTEHKLLRLAHSIERGFTPRLSDKVERLFSFDPFAGSN